MNNITQKQSIVKSIKY